MLITIVWFVHRAHFFHFNLFHIKGIGTVVGAYDRFDIMGFGYEITQEPMTFDVTECCFLAD